MSRVIEFKRRRRKKAGEIVQHSKVVWVKEIKYARKKQNIIHEIDVLDTIVCDCVYAEGSHRAQKRQWKNMEKVMGKSNT